MIVVLSAMMLMLGIALLVAVFMLAAESLGFDKELHDWLRRKLFKRKCDTCKFYFETGCAHPCEMYCENGCLWQKKEGEKK